MVIDDSCITDMIVIIVNCVLSPGVYINSGKIINQSIILTNTIIQNNYENIDYSILEKHALIFTESPIGIDQRSKPSFSMAGKNAIIPSGMIKGAGTLIGPCFIIRVFSKNNVKSGQYFRTRRFPRDI